MFKEGTDWTVGSNFRTGGGRALEQFGLRNGGCSQYQCLQGETRKT